MKTAFVLAAGKGERMMPLTKSKPKPLLKINGLPMMEYILRLLAHHNFKRIGINLFYKGGQIRNYFNDGRNLDLNIQYIQEKKLSGSAGGVKKIFKKIKPQEPFLVIASDMMINFDLLKIYEFHLKKKALATICCYFRSKKSLVAGKSGLVVFNKYSKQITNFIERPQTKKEIISQWVNSSVYVFNPEIVKYLPNQIGGREVIDLAKDIFPRLLAQQKKIYAYPIDVNKFYQLGVDTPERIKLVEQAIIKGEYKPVNITVGV